MQVGEKQLAHGAHDEKEEKPDDAVDHHNGGAGQADGFSGTHEQACSDGAANGDELDVTVTEASLQLAPIVIRGRGHMRVHN